MSIYATNGATVFICETPQTSEPDNAAAYQMLSWVEIGEVESLGSFGDTAEEITFAALNDERLRKVKGVRNAGSLELVMGIDYGDLGQLALIAAEKEIHDYAFKVLFNDAPAGGTPSERYFVAKVGSASEQLDTANNVMKLNASLWINSAVTRVNAAGGSGSVPNNTVLPAITGTPTEEQILSLSNGTWTGSPSPQFTYQWFAAGESLPGSTAATLVLTEDHVGKAITGMVKATNVIGTAYAMSAATSSVAGL